MIIKQFILHCSCTSDKLHILMSFLLTGCLWRQRKDSLSHFLFLIGVLILMCPLYVNVKPRFFWSDTAKSLTQWWFLKNFNCPGQQSFLYGCPDSLKVFKPLDIFFMWKKLAVLSLFSSTKKKETDSIEAGGEVIGRAQKRTRSSNGPAL